MAVLSAVLASTHHPFLLKATELPPPVAVYTLARPIQIQTPRRLAVLITLVADENKRLVKGRDDALLAFPSFSAVDDATADITLGRFDHCLFAPMLMIAPFARASKPPAIRPSPDLQLHADPGGDVAPEPPYDPVDDFRRSRSRSGARLRCCGPQRHQHSQRHNEMPD